MYFVRFICFPPPYSPRFYHCVKRVIFAVRSLVDFLDNLPFAFPPHHLGARSFLNRFTAIVCFVEADIVPCARVRIL